MFRDTERSFGTHRSEPADQRREALSMRLCGGCEAHRAQNF